MPSLEDNIARVAAYYAARAPEYHETTGYDLERVDARFARVKAFYQTAFKGHNVLEIACGTGYWTRIVAGTADSVLATDIHPELVDATRQRSISLPNVQCQVADAYRLDTVAGTFSGAFAQFWWSHIPRDRRKAFLDTLHARLEPGALVSFTDDFQNESASTRRRVDEYGDIYEERLLRDGSRFETIKNLPSESEFAALLEGVAENIVFTEWPVESGSARLWTVSYRLLKADRTAAPQPIIYSTLSTDGIRRLAIREYDFDDSTECIFFCRGVCDTYQLATPDSKFALRVYRKNWRTREAIQWEMATLKHLACKGVPVALPAARRDGELITDVLAPEGLRHAVLFHWAKGRAPRYTDAAQALQYGRLVAKMHLESNDVPADPSRPRMDLDYLLRRPLATIRTRLKEMPAVASALTALEERTLTYFERAQPHLKDWGLTHGDIWANNARIDGDHLVLFDFDFAGSGWRLFDLATYRWHARTLKVEQQAWPPFIEGYLQVRPEAAESLRFLWLFMILRHLWTVAHFIRRGPETGAAFLPDEELDDMVPFCEKLEAEHAAMN